MNSSIQAVMNGFLVFWGLWAITRVMGKKMIAQLTLTDFVLAVTIGSIGAQAVSPGTPTIPLLLGAVALAAMAFLASRLDLWGLTTQTLLDSEPAVLIENGQVLEENLRKNRLTIRQLESRLRLKGYFSIAQIEFALLETDGQVSVQPRSQYRWVRPADLGASTVYEGLSTQVIHEGKPLPERITGAGLTDDWLRNELRRQGTERMEEVFSAWLESDGTLTVDHYSDQPH